MRRLALPLLLALAACGQKGNLYLPDDGVEVVPVSGAADEPAAQPAPESQTRPAQPRLPRTEGNTDTVTPSPRRN